MRPPVWLNEYVPRGKRTTELHLRRRDEHYISLIDTEDVERVRPYRWTVSNGYVRSSNTVKNPSVGLARLVMDTPDHLVCDHRFHRTLDNRKSQLRNITQAMNTHNPRSAGPNIYRDKRLGKWFVRFKIHGRYQGYGCYKSRTKALRVAAGIRAKLRRGEAVPLGARPHRLGGSGVRSVVRSHVCEGKPWQAGPRVGRKTIHLGFYATIEEAAARVKQWEQEREDLKNAAHAA